MGGGTVKSLRVLIADDEAIIRLGLKTMLEEMGHQVVGMAADGPSAVRLAARVNPDLAILDIKMPDMDGMELMKRAGCHMIKFGVESGVQKILNNVRKGIKIENTRKNFREVKEVGIDAHAHIMLGMPGDTKKTIEETIKFVKEIDPTTATFGICTPYPGTPLFDDVIKKYPEIMDGSSQDLQKIHETAFFNQYFTNLDEKELNEYVKKAYRSFYFRPRYVLKWLGKIRSLDELRRVILAGSNVFGFGIGK